MQAMKVIERIANSLVIQVMTIDWVPWEDLYADGIVIIAYSMEEYVHKLLTWKEGMERKKLSERGEDDNHGLDLLQRSGNFPCAICRTGVGRVTHACTGCTRSAVGSSAFKMTQNYRCPICQGTAPPIDEDHRRRFRL